MGIAQIKAVWLWHWSAAASKPTRGDTVCQGKGKFGKLGRGKSCIVVYGLARSSECETARPMAQALRLPFEYLSLKIDLTKEDDDNDEFNCNTNKIMTLHT